MSRRRRARRGRPPRWGGDEPAPRDGRVRRLTNAHSQRAKPDVLSPGKAQLGLLVRGHSWVCVLACKPGFACPGWAHLGVLSRGEAFRSGREAPSSAATGSPARTSRGGRVEGCAGDDDPVDRVIGRLRPRGQLRGRLPAPAARGRGVARLPVHSPTTRAMAHWRGPLMPPEDVREVMTGIQDREALAEVDPVLSGYQGGEQIGEVILDAVARTKAANPAALYACDPVIGNAASGSLVHSAIPVLLRERLVPQADLITPNQFELGSSPRPTPATSTPPSTPSSSPGHTWLRRRPPSRASCAPTAPRAPSRCSRSGRPARGRPDAASPDESTAPATSPPPSSPPTCETAGCRPGPRSHRVQRVRPPRAHASSRGAASFSSSRARPRSPSPGCSSRPSTSADRAATRQSSDTTNGQVAQRSRTGRDCPGAAAGQSTRSSRWTTSRSYPGQLPGEVAARAPQQPGQLGGGVGDEPAGDDRCRRARRRRPGRRRRRCPRPR